MNTEIYESVSSCSDHSQQCKLDFEVSEFFMFGSPLALVLAYRKISSNEDKNSNIARPVVNQVYNMFHPTDPVAARLEPLISARFSLLPPVNVARYQKYPLGNGQPYHLRKLSSFYKFCYQFFFTNLKSTKFIWNKLFKLIYFFSGDHSV